MTRTSDRFVKLRNRTKFANRHHADIFVSIHANAIATGKDSIKFLVSKPIFCRQHEVPKQNVLLP